MTGGQEVGDIERPSIAAERRADGAIGHGKRVHDLQRPGSENGQAVDTVLRNIQAVASGADHDAIGPDADTQFGARLPREQADDRDAVPTPVGRVRTLPRHSLS